jgi:hypothetical protein
MQPLHAIVVIVFADPLAPEQAHSPECDRIAVLVDNFIPLHAELTVQVDNAVDRSWIRKRRYNASEKHNGDENTAYQKPVILFLDNHGNTPVIYTVFLTEERNGNIGTESTARYECVIITSGGRRNRRFIYSGMTVSQYQEKPMASGSDYI